MKYERAGIDSFPCTKCVSEACIHCNRKPCVSCAQYQYPETLVIHINHHIICPICIRAMRGLLTNGDALVKS